MPIDLYFPSLNGGVEQGLNDAGIETFEGDYQQHIIRECTQNALDARRSPDLPVTIRIQLIQVPAAEIPALGSIRRSIQSAKDYWSGNEKTERYCTKALNWTESKEVSMLEISDFGTKGLSGTDDDHHSGWFGLVRSGGVSINQDDAGGAFGIGKKAPFAGSFARTVFYSTLNQSEERAFQGAITLTTHLDSRNQKTQGSGFIGDVEAGASSCRSVRDPDRIPPVFRRTDVGTSIFALAYRDVFSGPTWSNIFVRYAIENFWPAIHRGILDFQIGETSVNSETLPSLMDLFASEGNFPTRFYYRAVRSDTCREWTTKLPQLGTCKLYLVPGDGTYPKKVSMTRQTGMLIYRASRFRSYRPFAGLFTCNSHEGNTYLRKLEPPRHDKWDPSRADSPGEAERVLKGIRSWINQCLRELNPDENVRDADVPELNRYLPDEEEDEPLVDEAPSASSGEGEGIVTAPAVETLPIVQVLTRPPVRTNRGPIQTPADGDEEGDGMGNGTPNPTDTATNTDGGQSETTGSGSDDSGSPRESKHHLNVRSLRRGSNEYNLIIRSGVSCSGRLKLVSVGEDNREDADLRIREMWNIDTSTQLTSEAIEILENQPLRIRVVVDSTIPLSLRAYCHGN